MKQYKDLNLKLIREAENLDFAHFTYLPGQCSCCYGPIDLPKIYWKDRKRPEWNSETHRYEIDGAEFNYDNINYILFKNADNGSGHVTKNDIIDKGTCIGYRLKDMEQVKRISYLLAAQLDEDYCVIIPMDMSTCIQIETVKNLKNKQQRIYSYNTEHIGYKIEYSCNGYATIVREIELGKSKGEKQ